MRFGVIKPGSEGPEVSNWQTNLMDVGYSYVQNDGTYDNATWSATVAFKQSVGLPGDGVVDDATLAAMIQRLDAGSTVLPTPGATEQIDIVGRVPEAVKQASPWLLMAVILGGATYVIWSQR